MESRVRSELAAEMRVTSVDTIRGIVTSETASKGSNLAAAAKVIVDYITLPAPYTAYDVECRESIASLVLYFKFYTAVNVTYTRLEIDRAYYTTGNLTVLGDILVYKIKDMLRKLNDADRQYYIKINEDKVKTNGENELGKIGL